MECFQVTIVTDKAAETFLEAAKGKDLAMQQELQQLDLYAEEFEQHEHCHRNFTRGFTKSSPENPRNEENGSDTVAFF